MSKVKKYTKYAIGALAALVVTVAPIWAVDALAAAHSVEVDGEIAPFAITHEGKKYIEVGPFDAFLGELTTESTETTIPLSLIKKNMLDFDTNIILDARIMKTGKKIEGTSTDELKLVLKDATGLAREGSGINFVNNEAVFQEITAKDGSDILMELPNAVTTEKGYAWYNIIGYSSPMVVENADGSEGPEYEVMMYYAIDVECESNGSVKIENASARTDNGIYICFTTDGAGRYTGIAAMYNLAFETDLKVTVPRETTTACLGDMIELKVDISSSNTDNLEIQWERGKNAVVQYSEGLEGATYKIDPVELKDFDTYTVSVTDGVVVETVTLKLVRDKNDTLPTVGLITSIKTAAMTDTAIKIQWAKPKNATKFAVYMRVGKTWKLMGATKGTAYTITGLNPLTTYLFAVRPYTSYYGVNVKAKTYKAIYSFTRPASVTTMDAEETSSHGAKFTWNKAKGASGYTVFVRSGSKWKKVANTRGTSYTTSYLKTGVHYTYAVRSYAVVKGKVVYSPTFKSMSVWYTRN